MSTRTDVVYVCDTKGHGDRPATRTGRRILIDDTVVVRDLCDDCDTALDSALATVRGYTGTRARQRRTRRATGA